MIRLRLRCAAILGGVFLAAAAPQGAAAQQPLGGSTGIELAPIFEEWRFGEGSQEMVRSARQLTVPIAVLVPVGSRLVVDAYAAWSSGDVRALDDEGGEQRYALSGVSDVKLRATARLAGDGVLLTFGVGLPTGRTELSAEEYAAVRVLGAPSLRFHSPAVGAGVSATSGIVLTRRVSSWAVGVGASYEYRGAYAPLDAAAAGMTSLDLDPGDAVRLTAGADRTVGASTMSVLGGATLSGRDRIRSDGAESEFRFGPAFILEWQLRTVLPGFSDVTLFAWERYRSAFTDASGTEVRGSAGNEVEIGVRATRPLGGGVALMVGVDGRHHTGLRVNEALATAAMVGGGAQVGVSLPLAGLSIQPFLRGQLGRMQSGNARFAISGLAGGLTIAR